MLFLVVFDLVLSSGVIVVFPCCRCLCNNLNALLDPFPFGWLLNEKAARVEVSISLAFLYWVGIALHT